jgi:hypothetical protein
VVGNQGRWITLGGTDLELTYHGLNHSDSTLVMRLPKEKIVFIVDTLPVGQVPGRGMIDFYPLEAETFIKQVLAMDWERLIPGHPGPGDRLGTKKDVEDQLALLQAASAEGKRLGQEGKCWDTAEKEFKISGYESWPGYANGLPFHRPALLRVVGTGHLNRRRARRKRPARGVFISGRGYAKPR